MKEGQPKQGKKRKAKHITINRATIRRFIKSIKGFKLSRGK